MAPKLKPKDAQKLKVSPRNATPPVQPRGSRQVSPLAAVRGARPSEVPQPAPQKEDPVMQAAIQTFMKEQKNVEVPGDFSLFDGERLADEAKADLNMRAIHVESTPHSEAAALARGPYADQSPATSPSPLWTRAFGTPVVTRGCGHARGRSASPSPRPQSEGPQVPDRDLSGRDFFSHAISDTMLVRGKAVALLNQANVEKFLKWTHKSNGRWEGLIKEFRELAPQGFTDLEFVRRLRRAGFKGDSYGIFRELKACRPPNRVTVEDNDEVSLTELLFFQDRSARALWEVRLREHSVGEVMRWLVQHLKQTRKYALRAWRFEVDTRQTGWVTLDELMRFFRRIGRSVEAVWIVKAIRPGRAGSCPGLPVHFAELGCEEASNMEKFAWLLRTDHGVFKHFRLETVWSRFALGAELSGHLSEDEFVSSCQRVGFTGDSKLLYNGLRRDDNSRLEKEDFFYLLKVSSVLRVSQADTTGFIQWAKQFPGGPDKLVIHLGLSSEEKPTASIQDVSSRLVALGFHGDAATAVCKSSMVSVEITSTSAKLDGVQVSGKSILALVNGGRVDTLSRPRSLSARRTRPSTPVSTKVVHSVEWDNLTYQTFNTERCKHDRKYFLDYNDRPVQMKLQKHQKDIATRRAEAAEVTPRGDARVMTTKAESESGNLTLELDTEDHQKRVNGSGGSPHRKDFEKSPSLSRTLPTEIKKLPCLAPMHLAHILGDPLRAVTISRTKRTMDLEIDMEDAALFSETLKLLSSMDGFVPDKLVCRCSAPSPISWTSEQRTVAGVPPVASTFFYVYPHPETQEGRKLKLKMLNVEKLLAGSSVEDDMLMCLLINGGLCYCDPQGNVVQVSVISRVLDGGHLVTSALPEELSAEISHEVHPLMAPVAGFATLRDVDISAFAWLPPSAMILHKNVGGQWGALACLCRGCKRLRLYRLQL